MKYYPIIGIEVHIELKTLSKMFCGCSAYHFRVKPNTHTCPVCLGLPGALPVPNKKAIDWCCLIGLALNCSMAKESKFDRKNYFYPDLPKGYQISQYDMPFCQKGKLKISLNGQGNDIRITRVHMEEDTGKLVHKTIDGEKYSLIDFNRSGVPLVEIVSEPDITSAAEAVLYLKKLQQIIRYLGVSDCDMEKGSMRCEINLSLTKDYQKLPGYKVEVKNINSFKFVKKAIEYEIQRQKDILLKNKIPVQETRGFNESLGKTVSQRSKEEAHDYRYFPEPDIPPITWTDKDIKNLKKLLPELPDEKIKKFVLQFGLSEYNATILVSDKKLADYFDQLVSLINLDNNNFKTAEAKQLFIKNITKMIVNKKVDVNKHKPKELITSVLKQKSSRLTDISKLDKIIDKVLKNNPKAIKDFNQGKLEAVGFLIGQVMKLTRGQADGQIIKKAVIEKLKKQS